MKIGEAMIWLSNNMLILKKTDKLLAQEGGTGYHGIQTNPSLRSITNHEDLMISYTEAMDKFSTYTDQNGEIKDSLVINTITKINCKHSRSFDSAHKKLKNR